MKSRTVESREFTFVGTIKPATDDDGRVMEERPQSRYCNVDNIPLNQYGRGPFCRFRVARGHRQGGVYIIINDQAALYVGECQNLDDRYSSNGYGGISPRNCFKGGQETNCRINNLILNVVKDGNSPTLWFHPVKGDKAARVDVEARLMATLRPAWNRGLPH